MSVDCGSTIVLGISGVSCGGKTLLSKQLVNNYPGASVIHMDDYYRSDFDPHLKYLPEYNYAFPNWDTMDAINSEKLIEDVGNKLITTRATSSPILVLEGIFIFKFRSLEQCFAKKYFITLPKEEAVRRRMHRHYEHVEPVDYFEKYGWPSYLESKDALKDDPNIVYLDGCDDIQKTFAKIRDDVDILLSTRNIVRNDEITSKIFS